MVRKTKKGIQDEPSLSFLIFLIRIYPFFNGMKLFNTYDEDVSRQEMLQQKSNILT